MTRNLLTIFLYTVLLIVFSLLSSFPMKSFDIFNLSASGSILFSLLSDIRSLGGMILFFLVLRKIVKQTNELKLWHLMIYALVFQFCVYNIIYLYNYIDYYIIQQNSVPKNDLKELLNLTNPAPNYDLYNHFIYSPYHNIMYQVKEMNLQLVIRFIAEDPILGSILMSFGVYRYYQKRPENIN